MAEKTVVAGSSVTAAQMKDFWRQVGDGSLNGEHIQALLEHRDPFQFERNRNGHIQLTITGLDICGQAEANRLKQAGINVWRDAVKCFEDEEYHQKHRLCQLQKYKVALVPGTELILGKRRFEEAISLGVEKYRYHRPVAGIMPRLREVISDQQLAEWGFLTLVGPHDPIGGHVLCLYGMDLGRYLSVVYVSEFLLMRESDMLAFVVSAQKDLRFEPHKK